MVEPKIVLLIFVSGKVVLTGGKVGIASSQDDTPPLGRVARGHLPTTHPSPLPTYQDDAPPLGRVVRPSATYSPLTTHHLPGRHPSIGPCGKGAPAHYSPLATPHLASFRRLATSSHLVTSCTIPYHPVQSPSFPSTHIPSLSRAFRFHPFPLGTATACPQVALADCSASLAETQGDLRSL